MNKPIGSLPNNFRVNLRALGSTHGTNAYFLEMFREVNFTTPENYQSGCADSLYKAIGLINHRLKQDGDLELQIGKELKFRTIEDSRELNTQERTVLYRQLNV